MKLAFGKRSQQMIGAASLLCCLGAIDAHAEDDFYLVGHDHFGIEEDDFSRMRILPTYMMETDTLFRAAEAERDSSMSMSHRILNNRWLLEDKKASRSGTSALRNYLRLSLREYLRNRRDSEPRNQGDNYSAVVWKDPGSQFTDLSNYRLRVSDDRVRVRFRYRFD